MHFKIRQFERGRVTSFLSMPHRRVAMVALFIIVTIELSTGQPILRTLLELD